MIDYMIANCGYPVIDVTAQEYAFVGIPEEIAAGPTIFNITNEGEQVHEMIVFRISDDVDLPVQEILQLPDEETEGDGGGRRGDLRPSGEHRPRRAEPHAGTACGAVLRP